MKYVINLPMTTQKRRQLNERMSDFSDWIVVKAAVLTLGTIILSLVYIMVCGLGRWRNLKGIGIIICALAIVSLLSNAIEKSLLLTWDEIDEEDNKKLELFNRFTIWFLPVLLWLNALGFLVIC